MKKISILAILFLAVFKISHAEINLNIISDQEDKQLLENFKRYIPNFSYTFYSPDTQFAQKVMEDIKPDRLPVIIYDKEKITPEERELLFKKRILIVRKGYNLFPPQKMDYLTTVKLLNRERIPNQLAIFTMSLCPYAQRAEWRIVKFIKEKNLPVDLKIYFIADIKDGEITSLHGPDEVEEDIHQVLIQKYWPDKLYDYLLLTEKVSHFEALKKVGISYAKIDRLREEGKKSLAENIKLANELGITASPTFMWENIYLISGLDNVMELLEEKAKELYNQTHPVVEYIFVGKEEFKKYIRVFDYLKNFFRLKGSFIPYDSPLASRYIEKYGIKTLPFVLILIKKSDRKVNAILRDKLKWKQTEYGFVLPLDKVIEYSPLYYLDRKELPDRLDILGTRKDIRAFKNSSFIKTLKTAGIKVNFYRVGFLSQPEIYARLGVKKLPLILWENKYLVKDFSQLLNLDSFQKKIAGLKSEKKIYIDFFYSPSCHYCRDVEEKVLPRIKAKYGGIVDIIYFDTLDDNNHKFLTRMEEFRKIEERGIPKIFIGKKVLIGRGQIAENLEQEILNCLISGEKIFKVENPLIIYYFYDSRQIDKDKNVNKIFNDIIEAEKRYCDEIIVKKYDTADKKNFNYMLSVVEKIKKDKDYKTPLVVINNEIYTPQELDNLDRIIQENILRQLLGERNVMVEKLKKFSLPAVLTAGLLDGINPCAFTVIVFFISFLTLAGYRKREMVYVGFSFILAVFIAYFLIGLGIFAAFYKLKFYRLLADIFRYIILVIVSLLAAFNIYDYIIYKIKKTPQSTVLQLPGKIKFLIQKTIAASYRKKEGESKTSFILFGVAFVSGFVVSLLESVCTGQVYFPTIGLLTQLPPDLRVKSLGYLFLYNLMFIIPLVIVFLLGLWGVTSDQFAKFMKRHLGKIKLATAFLFIFLAYILIMM